ncbi:MAG TPA: FlgD immunoglobulin-like domain containing protein [Vicinamibacterales bacterium]|nr:FlgD immunoglobulin-like domain containing protein [Vicinamibacterales bacterium]
MTRTRWMVGLSLVLALASQLPGLSQTRPTLNEAFLDGFTWRNLGPFRTGAWISDIAVPESPGRSHLYTFYVAMRYGGVWKTTNNGTTFTSIFDGQATHSIGAIAVAPSDERIVWVGGGDASNVRLSMPGDGVYKSADAGATWQHVGLPDSHHIARIVIHPTNPEIVYVAAMGHLWSDNEERGVFRTTDGGKTWKKVLYLDARTGVIDLVLNRRQPDTLFATTYDMRRYPWRLVEGGPGTGIFKTTDGGGKWTRLTNGLPRTPMGRIGLDIYQKNPNVLYAILENFGKRPPTDAEARQDRERKREPAERNIGGEIYRSDDGGASWTKMNRATDDVSSKAGYSFNQVRIDPNDDRRVFITSDALMGSEDSGRTWSGLTYDSRQLVRNAFGDFRSMWIDPRDSHRMLLGSDGGLHISYDGGKTADHYTNLPGGEFYDIDVDLEIPYNIYGGMQDHDSWKGPSNGFSGRIGLEDWVTVGDNDGMYNVVDRTDSRWIYNSIQWGGHHRADTRTHTRTRIEPTRPKDLPHLRWNWSPPLLLSPHNSQVIYTGAQVLFRSFDRGDHWEEISPDLTTNTAAKISPPGMTIQFCTMTTIAESPLKPGVLWVGTDDGRVQVTRTHGASWSDVTPAIAAAGGPADLWVTRVIASAHAPGTAYVTKSGHRYDRPDPLVFKTTDYGATWTAIHANLPRKPVNVIAEDPSDPDILFAGTHHGVFVSIDGGGRWTRMKGNMPTVPVTDLVIHPREADLVVATFGRGLFLTHIGPLREIDDKTLGKPLHFFAVRSRALRQDQAWGNYELSGDRYTYTENEPDGLVFEYRLARKTDRPARITIADAAGATLRVLEGPAASGLNRAAWNGNGSKQQPVPPGDYTVTIDAAGETATRKARLLTAARYPPP